MASVALRLQPVPCCRVPVIEGDKGDDVLIDPEGRNRMAGGPGDDHLEGSGLLDGRRPPDRRE